MAHKIGRRASGWEGFGARRLAVAARASSRIRLPTGLNPSSTGKPFQLQSLWPVVSMVSKLWEGWSGGSHGFPRTSPISHA
eukprot:366443-Chlamydomonas_euryale.AAC.1